MLDSILNASWWPWSRNKPTPVTPTSTLIPTSDANLFEKLTTAGSVPTASDDVGHYTPIVPSLLSPTVTSPRESTILNTILSGGENGDGNNHYDPFDFHGTGSSFSSPDSSPPDTPISTVSGQKVSLPTSFDFNSSSVSSSLYNALNAAVNRTRQFNAEDTNRQSDDDDSPIATVTKVTSTLFEMDRNLTSVGTIITYDNYTTNYANDTMATILTAVVASNDSNDYNWLVVPPWNCSTCQPSLLPFDSATFVNANGTPVNQTEIIFGNGDGIVDESSIYFVQIILTALVLGIVILSTVIGNVFVIAAILLERNLQSVSNHLILSLAVADLLVACLVMPLGAVYEVSREWSLGPELCDMWTSSDVLCCTASILHLVAIALDRYWAVTDIDYAHQRTAKRIGVMILVVWALSVLVSIAPLLGWKDPGWNDRLHIDRQCIVSQDIGYQIFATASSFYVPLLVILFLYWRIFLTARKRIRRRQQGKSIAQLMPKPPFAFQTHSEPLALHNVALTAGFRWKVTQPSSSGGSQTMNPSGSMVAAGGGIAAAVVAVIGRPLPTISETTTQFTTVSSTHTSPEKSCGNGVDKVEPDLNTADISMVYGQGSGGGGGPGGSMRPSKQEKKAKSNKAQTESKRERKAAKTLAIITGAFVCCWLPFFILAILLPTCPSCNISPFIMSLCLWLGYFNSTLNPIIYTIFSPEFRHAFKRILCGRRHSNRRRRHLGIKNMR